jgi:hypothetical protein
MIGKGRAQAVEDKTGIHKKISFPFKVIVGSSYVP